jgi:predicted nucleic acid-binding protein
MKKHKIAISDTDILINLAKIDKLDILELLFDGIIIPQYVYDKELTLKAGKVLGKINSEITKNDSIFKVVDRKKDFVINKLAEPVIREKYDYIGKGESECAGYASALGASIIVSDNTSDFKWLDDEYIMLTHNNILSICVSSKLLTEEEAEEMYDSINKSLSKPSSLKFPDVYSKSMRRFRKKGWNDILGIK